MEPQKPREYVNIEPCIRELESGGTTVSYTVSKTINLADLPAVSGPPIQHDDIRLGWAHSLGWRSSGVMGEFEIHVVLALKACVFANIG